MENARQKLAELQEQLDRIEKSGAAKDAVIKRLEEKIDALTAKLEKETADATDKDDDGFWS